MYTTQHTLLDQSWTEILNANYISIVPRSTHIQCRPLRSLRVVCSSRGARKRNGSSVRAAGRTRAGVSEPSNSVSHLPLMSRS